MKKEYERFTDSTFFEGLVSLRVLIANAEEQNENSRDILEVYYDRNRAKKEKKEAAWLSHRAQALGFLLTLTDRSQIDAIAVGNTHGGILACCGSRQIPAVDSSLLPVENGFYVMLAGIEDPYNFGYALRSLYAAGVDGVILGEHNWMSAAGVVCRASAGASERLPMWIGSDVETVTHFRRCGYTIVCADLRESVPLHDATIKKPVFLIVGGEKRGISRTVLKLSDLRVAIEYARPFDASLSAASAATVVAYEIFRQNRQ